MIDALNRSWGNKKKYRFCVDELEDKNIKLVGSVRLDNEYDVSYTGLIHVSGIESDIPANHYRDSHRILIGSADKLKSKEQIKKFVALGYKGDISFEPFAEDIQQMQLEDLKTAINESIEYMFGS